MVNVRRCFIGSDIAGGLRVRIGGEQAVCLPPLWARGRDGERQPLLKTVSEGERIFGVELAHTGGKETTGGPEEMPEDMELILQGSGPLP